MKLRTKYILLLSILHLVALVLTYFIFQDNKILFIVSEVLVIISSVISFNLYRQLIQPLQLLMQGAEAIRDRDFNVKFTTTGKYEMDALIDIYNKMIDELRTERTRQEQQHFFLEKLIYTSPTGILILDYDDHIHEVNPKALKLLNLAENELLRKRLDEVAHPVMKEIKLLAFGSSTTVTFNGVNTYKIQKSHFIDRGFARHFVMLEELTAEILAAEKKAYGKVIRMMAHEVNNTIGPVNSILQSALSSDKIWTPETQSFRSAIEVAHDRNNNLNTFMRNFADVVRLPDPVKKRVDLHHLVTSVATLMQMKAGEKNIEFVLLLSPGNFWVEADERQLEQVMINIVKNAIESIEQNGVITISTDLSQKHLFVTDSGKGISENISHQLFTPFFSTRRDGQGIGLTLVKEILLNHHFEFSLKTIRSEETSFFISFKEQDF